MKKLLCVLLIISMLFAISPTATAATYVKKATLPISGGSQYGKYATAALWTANDRYVPFSTSNHVTHNYGTQTTYNYERTETVTCTASSTLATGDYSDSFSILIDDLNVVNSAFASVRLGYPYSISSTEATGNYQFRAKFTCYKVIEEVVVSTSNGDTVEWTNTISSAPKNENGTVVHYKT